MLDQNRRDQLNSIIDRMKANKEDDTAIRSMVEQFKAKYDAPEAPVEPPSQPGPEKSSIFPSAVAEYENRFSKPAGSIGQSVKDFGAVGAAAAGDLAGLAQRGAAAMFTDQQMSDPGAHALKAQTDAAVEAARTREKPTGYIPPGVMWQPPELEPAATEFLGRAIDDPANYAFAAPKIVAKGAKALGAGREALSELARKGLNSQGMRTAAEKSILDNYAPRLRAEFAPPEPVPGGLEKASGDLAGKLKESGLLHAPEQAKINLNAGLEKVGGAIEKTIKQATELDVSVNVKDVVDGYAAAARNVMKKTGKNAAEIKEIEGKVLPRIQEIIANLGPDELGNIPLDKGVEFRRALQNMVKNWDGDNKNVAQLVAKKLSSSMNEKIIASHPTHGPRLAMLNERYAALKDAEPMIEEGYAKAYAKATGVKVNDRGVPLTKQGVIDRTLEKVLNPRESLLKMRPKLAEQIANDGYLPQGSASEIPEYIARPPTVTADELSALGMEVGPKPQTLPPRTPSGRPALEKPPTYIQGAAKEGLPPRQPINTRRPFEEKPPTYVEGNPRDPESLPPRQPVNARRPLDEKPPTYIEGEAPNGFDIIPTEKGLPPRVPKGDVKPNGFPSNLESPEVSRVLNEAGRRAIVLNQPRIEKLKEALKRATTKEARENLQALLRAENYKIPLSQQVVKDIPKSISPDAFLKILDEANGWPPGLNEEKISELVKSYHKSKPDAVKAKIMAALRKEWDRAASLAVEQPRYSRK